MTDLEERIALDATVENCGLFRERIAQLEEGSGMKQLRDYALIAVHAIAVIWFVSAEAVFAIRHPWATDTERLIHTGDALLFRSVPYDSMRPRS